MSFPIQALGLMKEQGFSIKRHIQQVDVGVAVGMWLFSHESQPTWYLIQLQRHGKREWMAVDQEAADQTLITTGRFEAIPDWFPALYPVDTITDFITGKFYK